MDFMFTLVPILLLGFLVFVGIGSTLGFVANAARGRLAAQVTEASRNRLPTMKRDMRVLLRCSAAPGR